MNGLTKEVTATCGNVSMSVGLSHEDRIMYVKSTVRLKPKNRKMKKMFKKQSYKMKKVAKGEYDVTTYCSSNPKVFAEMIDLLKEDENGKLWFNIDKKSRANGTEIY